MIPLLSCAATEEDPNRVGSAAGGAAPAGGQPYLTDGIGALLRFTNPQ
jgi:hypothetical protein